MLTIVKLVDGTDAAVLDAVKYLTHDAPFAISTTFSRGNGRTMLGNAKTLMLQRTVDAGVEWGVCFVYFVLGWI